MSVNYLQSVRVLLLGGLGASLQYGDSTLNLFYFRRIQGDPFELSKDVRKLEKRRTLNKGAHDGHGMWFDRKRKVLALLLQR
jgi:hypothetical protein